MGVGAGLYTYDVVVKKFTFAVSSPDEFLYKRSPKNSPSAHHRTTLPKHIFATEARIDNRK